MTQRIARTLIGEIEQIMKSKNEYSIDMLYLMNRYNISVSTCYNVMRIIKLYFIQAGYDVWLQNGTLTIKRKQNK